MSRWRTIIFDLDDTLFPEREYVLSGFRAVAAWAEAHLEISGDVGYQDLVNLFEDGVRGDTFDRWLRAHGASLAAVPHLVAAYRDHRPALQPFPAIAQWLPRLHQKARIGLVTDGYLQVQQRKFKALGLSDYFHGVVFSDEWGRAAWKPSVRPFLAVLDRLGAPAETAVYIADNPTKDFYGARLLGMETIWARHSNGDYTQLKPPSALYAADHTVDSFKALAELLHTHGCPCT